MARYYFPAIRSDGPAQAGGPQASGGTGANAKTSPTPRIAQAPAPPPDPLASALETNYSRIMETIKVMWGHQELNDFFRRLTLDDRGGRQGFPPDAWAEIQLLASLHLEVVPENRNF